MNDGYDVVLVGYGPVSQLLALMLGRQGRRVAVVERWEARYPLPRAVCIDHELFRVLAANGMGDVLPKISHPGPLYQWFNADWRELLCIDWSAESISGGAEVNFVHQPTLEEALDQAVSEQRSVTRFLGWEAIEIQQDPRVASARLRKTGGLQEQTLTARYVVGCDGANSIVRETIGGAQEDRGFEADWLVIDVLLKEGCTIETLGIPAAGQYCNPVRPTTIVPAGVRDGRTFRRWEFMRLPGESIENLEREDRVWELLKPWAGPDQIELIRHKVYNFRSLLAQRWHERRLIIAGDAAHVMPPFMGQGMCSGMRDAGNLAWKLALILDGKADDRLLDTYQPERMPHVSQIIDASIYLGRIICIPDADDAAARDRVFFEGAQPPPPPFPQLTDGLIHRRPDGAANHGAGLLSPHVHVSHNGLRERFDEVAPPGFILLSLDPAPALPPHQIAALDTLGARYVHIENGNGGLCDLDGKFAGFLEAHGWRTMLTRPDFYVYGGAATAQELGKLIDDFIRDLSLSGVKLMSAPDGGALWKECDETSPV